MQVKQRSGEQKKEEKKGHRPLSFNTFIGQSHIKSIITTAVKSAHTAGHSLGHILLAGPSGYGKTTIAQIISQIMGVRFFQITAYAINKPADIISMLQKLEKNDILFIDEVHRLKTNLEEILYIAMEDQRIDLIMPDGTNLNLPVEPFTLVGATTQPEKLSQPLKNRFIYSFHLEEYDEEEKQQIIDYHMDNTNILYDKKLITQMSESIDSTPRNIKNFCIKIRDYLIAHEIKQLTQETRKKCQSRINTEEGGLTPLHKKYINILKETNNPTGIKTIAAKLGMTAESIEQDIEPLLLKKGKIQRTPRGRIIGM